MAERLLGMAESLDTGKVEAMAGVMVKLLEADRAGPEMFFRDQYQALLLAAFMVLESSFILPGLLLHPNHAPAAAARIAAISAA